MKNISKIVLGVCCASMLSMTGCIEETFPTSAATEEGITSSTKGLEAKLWAMPAFALNFGTVSTSAGYDWGYGSIMHIRDVMTQDMPIVQSNYDHYSAWEGNYYIGPMYLSTQFIWNYFWKFVQTTNNMIAAVSPDETDREYLGYLGAGHAYRAFLYLDMAQMYEFLPNDIYPTGVNGSGNDVTNLTVPIVRENITEEQARNNPRATREEMAEFILSDLDKAEELIVNLPAISKLLPDLSVVYGLKARFYMWLADYPNAQKYANKAITESACRPLTKDEWMSTSTGFNDLNAPAWMWGAKAQKENDAVQTGILNWTSWASNEVTYGYAFAGPQSMIDAQLYSRISDDDFRKLTWVAPAGSALEGQNVFVDNELANYLVDYASLKFRPGGGNISDFNIGSATAFPLMRIEEMYLIEAEAVAHQDAIKGKELIEKFMTQYRYSTYTCEATATEDVVEEIVLQKRIELWGEGQTFFDVKRLNMSVMRNYKGSNFGSSRRFNTNGRPAWMNICIVQTEENNNLALKGYENPDPSDMY
jgi:tetratricopeptide (TPR) repeat protein